MAPRVIFIGLDAAEATLIDRWATAGELPAFAELRRSALEFELANSMDTLPGAIWPEIGSGRCAGKVGLYFHPTQIHSGEARLRKVEIDEVDTSSDFWVAAGRAGKRVAVFDIPQAGRAEGIDGIQLREWGLHDRAYGVGTEPPELLAEIRSRYGDHPIASCDDHGETAAGYEWLLDGLLDGIKRKTGMLLDFLATGEYDLLACAFSESHCAGHQFWHFHDPDARGGWPDPPKRLTNAILEVYRALDNAVGRLISAAGPEATAIVMTSHGMGPYLGGPQLLPEVLARLGMSSAPETPRRRALRSLHNTARKLPRPLKDAARPLTELRGFRRAQQTIGASLEPFESPRTRAAILYNNRCGAIRLNVAGRDPFGQVQPGAEANALLDELRAELSALRDPDSGETIVARVTSAAEAFGPGHHVDLPDLITVFRRDIGPIEACSSARIGTVRIPIYTNTRPRFGDHTDETRLWIEGPGIDPGRGAGAHVLDVAPTVLAALGVPVPGEMDGNPISAIGERQLMS